MVGPGNPRLLANGWLVGLIWRCGFLVAVFLCSAVHGWGAEAETVGEPGASNALPPHSIEPVSAITSLSCNTNLFSDAALGADAIPRAFSLFSWNIEKGDNAEWIDDLIRLADEASVLLFQEAALDPDVSRLPLPVVYSHNQYFAAGYQQGERRTGVLIASPWATSDHCSLTAWEPWLGTPKATSVTRFLLTDDKEVGWNLLSDNTAASREQLQNLGVEVGKKTLMIVNAHAVNFAVGLEAYTEQFEEIGEVIGTHDGPLIVAGDFNTWSEERQAWLDTFADLHQLHAVKFDPDRRTTIFSRPIDHIYTRGLDIVNAQAVPVGSSDHNPLLIRVQIDAN